VLLNVEERKSACMSVLFCLCVKVLSAQNYSCSLDHVILIGKLLHMNPELSQELIANHGWFVCDCMCMHA